MSGGNNFRVRNNIFASNQDTNSVSLDPVYVSATDLHLTVSSPVALQAGTDLTSVVPYDIDGGLRAVMSWMGVDEYGVATKLEEPKVLQLDNIQLYPNPTYGEFMLSVDTKDISNESELHISITHLVSSQLVYVKKLSSFNNSYKEKINLKSFAKGIYSLRIIAGDTIWHQKIVLQ